MSMLPVYAGPSRSLGSRCDRTHLAEDGTILYRNMSFMVAGDGRAVVMNTNEDDPSLFRARENDTA